MICSNERRNRVADLYRLFRDFHLYLMRGIKKSFSNKSSTIEGQRSTIIHIQCLYVLDGDQPQTLPKNFKFTCLTYSNAANTGNALCLQTTVDKCEPKETVL